MRSLGIGKWLPMLGLICCGVMAWLYAGILAGQAEDGARSALDAAGLEAVVDYGGVDGFDGIGRDGLNVVLEGPASAEILAVEAVQSRSEIDRVIYRVAEAGTGSGAGAEVTEESEVVEDDGAVEAPDPVPGLDPASVTATANGAGIRLEGSVPNTDTRDALITVAVNEFGAANVTHDLVVDPENVSAGDGTLTLTGRAMSTDEQRGWQTGVSAVASASDLGFVDQSIIQTVDQSLNELFALEPIEFDISQATIRSRSEPTLDRAIAMLNADTGVDRLRVVGHTDSDGSTGTNQQLSEARAQAVVDYLVANGVASQRLEAEGRGESELLVDPEVTPEDKQRNRRIEWEVIS